MKKRLLLAFLGSGTCFVCFANSIVYPPVQCGVSSSHHLDIVNALDITESYLNRFMLGENPELTIEFSNGTILPLNLFLKSNLINIVENEEQRALQIEVKQTFYVRIVEKEFVFSSDLTEWKPFFEFATGNIGVAFGTQEGRYFMTLEAEANLRETQIN